jgi:predicted nucleotidyltransferase
MASPCYKRSKPITDPVVGMDLDQGAIPTYEPSHARAAALVSSAERAIALKGLRRLAASSNRRRRSVVFAVVTGTHQYGFTSPDSDIDVRGAVVYPTDAYLGLGEPRKHLELMEVIDGREVDGLLFEVGRFLELVTKGSGNLLEELFSPLVLAEGEFLSTLREAVAACFSKQLVRHYLGFFDACRRKVRSTKKTPEVKHALYAARIALTGITLLREGRVEAHLPTLNETAQLDYVDEWIRMKVTEHEPLPPDRVPGVLAHLKHLRAGIKAAVRQSVLPARPSDEALARLDELLVRIRRSSS